jgi:hypothetical protein
MHTFEITIQRKTGDGWPVVVVEQGQIGSFLPVRSEGHLALDQVELLRQSTPLDYGTVLGKALFRDQVRDAFTGAQAKSEDDLRVLLFVEDGALKILHWERLCAPLGGGWDFLALDKHLPFSLDLPSSTDLRFSAIGRRDLRALILVANPQDLGKYGLADFDAAATVASVQAALGDIPSDVLANVESAVGLSTLDELARRITAEAYTLLHIVAHGQYQKRKGETALYLADDRNQVAVVSASQFITRLRRLQVPHFAFLSTCESARPEAEGAGSLGGLAQRLVSELGMPAVLAMTERVSIPTAEALSETFYRRLREHGEPDRALVEATAGLAERGAVTVAALSRTGWRSWGGCCPSGRQYWRKSSPKLRRCCAASWARSGRR